MFLWSAPCFSFSLFGVCLMAFHQAQYILSEFSTPNVRSNHNSVLSRENSSVNNNSMHNGVTYVQRSFWGEFINCLRFFMEFCALFFAVKQRAVVRATWTPVIPQIRERGVALQPWPTAPHHVITPPKKVPQPLHLRHKRNPKFHSITPNTSPAPPQPLVW